MPARDRQRLDKRTWRGPLRQAVLAKTGGVCALCGSPGRPGRGGGLQLGHIIPADRGGPDDVTNLVPLCASCHQSYDSRHRHTRGAL